jgi:hypothetical protein
MHKFSIEEYVKIAVLVALFKQVQGIKPGEHPKIKINM